MMSNNEQYSDEFINAFISGELSDEDKTQFIEALNRDDILRQRYSQLEAVKQGIQYAYVNIKSKQENTSDSTQQTLFRLKLMLAVSIVAIGILSSTILNYQFKDQSNKIIPIAFNQGKAWRVVLHVNTVDSYLQKTLLDETEHLLKSFENNKSKLKVEIVAYGPGLEFLSLTKSKYARQLIQLQKKYPNLSFAACGRTIKRMVSKTNKKPVLLPNTYIAPSGIRQIIKRQKQGWSYIRI